MNITPSMLNRLHNDAISRKSHENVTQIVTMIMNSIESIITSFQQNPKTASDTGIYTVYFAAKNGSWSSDKADWDGAIKCLRDKNFNVLVELDKADFDDDYAQDRYVVTINVNPIEGK